MVLPRPSVQIDPLLLLFSFAQGPEAILIDTRQHRYIALKIYIHSSKPNHDVQVLEHLAACRTDHPGKQLVRNMIDSFEITGPKGSHQCVVQDPLLTSLLHFQATLNPMSLTEALIKGALQQLLLALDFLHTEAHVVHTG